MDGGRIKGVVSVLMYPWVATCAETRERLSAHLEGELEGRRARRVRRHLDRCPRCQAMLRSLTRAVGALRSLGQEPPAPAVPSAADAVVARIRHGDMRGP